MYPTGTIMQMTIAMIIFIDDDLGSEKWPPRKGFLAVVLRISFNKWHRNARNWQYGRQNQRPKPLLGIRGPVVMAVVIYGYGNKCPQLRLTRE